MRAAGILLPIFSLPTKYGVGGFSKEAYDFVDFLAEAHQRYWQILPLGPTGYGDSPYQTFSTFAGNPYFISLEKLTDEGLITAKDCARAGASKDKTHIDYEKLYRERFKVLQKACENSLHKNDKNYKAFIKNNSFWIEDYALFMAIKNSRGGVAYTKWEVDIRFRKDKALRKYKKKLAGEIDFQKFLQYKFYQQYFELKAYANKKGIMIIGDIPIYVSPDSSDIWARPGLFQVNDDGTLKAVAGCPPDAFSELGQLWGNPLYNWEEHAKEGYSWWIKRIECCTKLYDVVRIDHFRGFDQYYSIPTGDKDARGGHWEDGPGMELFKAVKQRLGKINIIAEDLGLITPSVRRLVKATGFPNMKVLGFAFDPNDKKGAGEYLPHNYPRNCVVYTGTHDNETLAGWYKGLKPANKRMIRDYLGLGKARTEVVVRGIVRLALSSVADYAVIPMQDYLCLDNSARINYPSTLGGNWEWRCDKSLLTRELAEDIAGLTDRYGRCNG